MGPPFAGPWSFKHHPWTREMHDSGAMFNVGQKSAQMGYTETLLNITFKAIDIDNEDVLYVLPSTTPDAKDFSASRFDPALELSAHLRELFSDVRNVGHKRAGCSNLFIRGSKTRSGLKSIPTPKVMLDEVDEFLQANIPLAFERMSGQIDEAKLVWMISTPTVAKYGINQYFDRTTKEEFFFPCPMCSKHIALRWPESVVFTADHKDDPRIEETRLICTECKGTLHHKDKPSFLADGKFVPAHPNRSWRGFYVNQLYSCVIPPKALVESYLIGKLDLFQEQEFYNSKLGLPHEPDGARVTQQQIALARGEYKKLSNSHAFTTMGVDVGKLLHVEIDEWQFNTAQSIDPNESAIPRVVWEGTVEHFAQLNTLMRAFNVNHCVIDANPETRSAESFAFANPGKVTLCYYSEKIKERNLVPKAYKVTVNRTSWMDMALGRFKNLRIRLPLNVSVDYQDQIREPVRIFMKDATGNPVARWLHTAADHFAHARTYAEIALPFATSHAYVQSTENPL